MHKFLFVFVLGFIVPAHVFSHEADKKQEIYSITQIHELCPFLTNLPKGAVVVFDVDFVIIAPADDIGLPGSREIRKMIFRGYSKDHGKQQAEDLFVLFNKLVKRPLVEARIRPIIQDLMKRGVHTIALSAISAEPVGAVLDPMELRAFHLQDVGIYFVDVQQGERVFWGENAGFYKGAILSGRQEKGVALLHYLEKIAQFMPSKIIFIDDHMNNIESVQKMCQEQGIPFVGFHYVADTLKGRVADPDIARLQFKILYEEKRWVTDAEARALW